MSECRWLTAEDDNGFLENSDFGLAVDFNQRVDMLMALKDMKTLMI